VSAIDSPECSIDSRPRPCHVARICARYSSVPRWIDLSLNLSVISLRRILLGCILRSLAIDSLYALAVIPKFYSERRNCTRLKQITCSRSVSFEISNSRIDDSFQHRAENVSPLENIDPRCKYYGKWLARRKRKLELSSQCSFLASSRTDTCISISWI